MGKSLHWPSIPQRFQNSVVSGTPENENKCFVFIKFWGEYKLWATRNVSLLLPAFQICQRRISSHVLQSTAVIFQINIKTVFLWKRNLFCKSWPCSGASETPASCSLSPSAPLPAILLSTLLLVSGSTLLVAWTIMFHQKLDLLIIRNLSWGKLFGWWRMNSIPEWLLHKPRLAI